MFWHCLCFSHFLTMTMSLLSNLPSMLQFHIMDSHGICNWYSQLTLRVLHNAYSSQRWPMLRFFLIWYVGWRSARLVICGAWNGPSGCLWYDEWPTKFHKENVISLETCDIQLSNSMYYILVTSVYCMSQGGPSADLWSIRWTIWLFARWWVFHQTSCWEFYIPEKLWYAAVQ